MATRSRIKIQDRPVLGAGRGIARPPRLSDKIDRLRCGRNPELTKMYGGDYRNISPMTPADVNRWYKELITDPLAWAIESDGKCVGHARLHQMDIANRSARYAVGIFDNSVWSHGVGTTVTRLVLRYAFKVLGLHRLELITLSYNARAIRCFQKCGFVQEGIERDSALVSGEWRSDIRVSILEDEYRNVCKDW